MKKNKNIFRSIIITLLVGFIVTVIAACSTEKDALINKGFHNMNARYNGYFNAGLIINESLTDYRGKIKEDYTKILPLEAYPSEEEAVAMYPQMDDAIERCSKVIYKHAMPNPNNVRDKDVENCAWIDDNWLVIGKSHFVKREYTEAIKNFKYIKKAYIGHESIYAAKIWLAKTYITQGEFSKAKIELDKVTLDIKKDEENKKSLKDRLFDKEKSKKKVSKYKKKKIRKEKRKNKKFAPAKFPKKLKAEYEITFADLYINQENYKKAIEHLEKGIELSKKKDKFRLMFVLAQLHQEAGNSSNAIYLFNKVAKSSAPYEMRFYAKIKKALSSKSGDENLRKDLKKMLKDAKNEEYKDQIYYVLAELDLKDGQKENAKSNLTKSVMWSLNNDRQKGMSYLKLADMHFEETDYIKAQKYYDSCVNVLPKSYKNFESIQSKAAGLADLVFNYEIVQRQDSLLRIASMSEKDREKFLKNTVKQIKEDEKREKAEKEAKLLALQERLNKANANSGVGGKWYFYNQKLKGSGFNTFRAEWGQIKLEDNWRRSNKESVGNFDDIVEDSLDVEDDGLTVDDLRKDLPLTPQAIDSSNTMMLDAMYNLGIIYKEQLNEEDKAITYFNGVIDKQIIHPKILPSAYQLYLIYKKTGSAKSNNFKNIILTDYPNSDIAKLILDPDYLKKKEKIERKSLDDYASVMKDYRYQRYVKVVTQCNDVINNDKNNTYINKYYLLKAFALSESNIGGVPAVVVPLEELVALSPKSEEGIQAKIYLNQIQSGGSISNSSGNQAAKIEYKRGKLSKHKFVLIFPNHKGNINDVKIKIANFNITYFKNDNLKMTNGIIGNNDQTILVSDFLTEDKAMKYYNALNSTMSSQVVGNVPQEYQNFIITKSNFILFYNNKDIDGYIDYFTKTYK